jgi:type IV secretion system protein TrbI
MADPVAFDETAERLKIRSSPRPVARINRKMLLAGACVGALLLFAAASIALAPPGAGGPVGEELYNTTNTRTPDGLASLPSGYGDVLPVEERVARLGPPLSGDLGSTILQAERDLGIEPEYVRTLEDDFRPNPADEAARARRMRAAAMAEEAARAPVFFQLQSGAEGADLARSPGTARTDPAAGDIGSELLALANLRSGAAGGLGSEDANFQDRKIAFAGSDDRTNIYNPHRIEDPASPYQVMAGTLITASLVTGINSDLPGTIVAQVTQPVYDTVTGQYLLIPQGSRLIGRYQSEVSFGQDRALVTWDRIIFPDGSSIVISAPGADARGFAGLSDRVDHHWDRVFVAAGLATILGIGAELGSGGEDDIERAVRRGVGETVNQAGQRVVDRNLGIQPTLRVRPGWPVRVVVTRDLILRPH